MATLPDLSVVDAAVYDTLAGDATLAALMPGGVHWDLAPEGATAYVIVASLAFATEMLFADGGHDRPLYLAKAVTSAKNGTGLRDAAARIHDLLEGAMLPLDGSGYAVMRVHRVDRVRYKDRDPALPSSVFAHRGGQYEVMVTR